MPLYVPAIFVAGVAVKLVCNFEFIIGVMILPVCLLRTKADVGEALLN